MPSTWLPGALQAQAVAARSFALASRKAGAPFDVYADGRSQAYLGVSAETPRGDRGRGRDGRRGAPLRRRRRDDVLLLEHRRLDAVGGRRVRRRRASRISSRCEDPYDTHLAVPRLGPGAGHRQDAREVRSASRAGIVDATVDAQLVAARQDAQGHVALARASRRTTSVSGSAVTSALGLRSTWFSVGVLVAPAAVSERAGRSGHDGHADRRRARRPRRRPAGAEPRRRRGRSSSRSSPRRKRRIPPRRQAESDDRLPAGDHSRTRPRTCGSASRSANRRYREVVKKLRIALLGAVAARARRGVLGCRVHADERRTTASSGTSARTTPSTPGTRRRRSIR